MILPLIILLLRSFKVLLNEIDDGKCLWMNVDVDEVISFNSLQLQDDAAIKERLDCHQTNRPKRNDSNNNPLDRFDVFFCLSN